MASDVAAFFRMFVRQSSRYRAAAVPADPEERLASIKEFGEHGGVNGSIETSTTFTVLTAGTLPAIFQGEVGPETGGCYVYGRSFNPTVRALAKQLAALEDTEAAYATSSGMAAISSTLLALCKSGDHIIASNTVYGGTFAFLKSFLPVKCNISTTFVDITNVDAVKAAIKPNTKVIYCEAMGNPTLVISPLPQLAEVAHSVHAQLVVDNTFTPCIITPKHHGADVIVHSMTKFMSGASDIIAGCICGSRAFINSLMDFHTGPLMLLGPTMDPKIAAELMLRLPHLGLRMQEHSRRALAMAEHLHSVEAKVTYPGLPTHPQYELLKSMANPGYGLGGLLGVDLGSKAAADAFMERLQNKYSFGYMAVSLGYFDTLMSASAASTSSELDPDDMEASGISHGYVRMSVGITGSLEQRLAQLEDAYSFIAKGGANAPYRAVKVLPSESGAPGSLLTWPSLGSETCLDMEDEGDGVEQLTIETNPNPATTPNITAAGDLAPTGASMVVIASSNAEDKSVLAVKAAAAVVAAAVGSGAEMAGTSSGCESGGVLARTPSAGGGVDMIKVKVRRLANGVEEHLHPVLSRE